MTSSGLIHGIGTSVPPQKRSRVETVTSRPSRAAARVGGRIGGSCRGGGAARPNTMRGDAARRSEGDGPRRAPGGARAGGVLAAERLPRFFPMLMTAAGTVAPAKVLVLGAGVAGLQAIATARRLGAVVTGFDVRPVVKEQVESLGATFLELGVRGEETEGGYARELTPEEQERQQDELARVMADFDVVITTALVPGRPAPKLIPASTVGAMRAGSVIVDVAAEAGGNCELTEPGSVVERHGVTIVGVTNVPATMPFHASQLYSRNVAALLQHLAPAGEVRLDFDDEITARACVTRTPA